MKTIGFLMAFFSFSILLGKNRKLDSLVLVYTNESQSDTNRLKAIFFLASNYAQSNPDTAIILALQQLELAQKSHQKKYEFKAYNILGISYAVKGDKTSSLNHFLSALKISEELNDIHSKGDCYMNIGLLYKEHRQFDKAMEYCLRAIEINDKNGIMDLYTNMGLIYEEGFSDFDKAVEYYKKALVISKQQNDLRSLQVIYSNLANATSKLGKFTESLEYHFNSLTIAKSINNAYAISLEYLNLGGFYEGTGNFKLATKYCDSSLQVSKNINELELKATAYHILASSYSKTKNFELAYNYEVKFKQYADSIYNIETSKQFSDIKIKFEVNKKEIELKSKAEAQKAITDEERKRQQFVIYSVSSVLLILLLFSSLLYKRYKITKKQKLIIEEKNKEVEEKNKDILDSLKYARRIQKSLLPTEKYIHRILGNKNIHN